MLWPRVSNIAFIFTTIGRLQIVLIDVVVVLLIILILLVQVIVPMCLHHVVRIVSGIIIRVAIILLIVGRGQLEKRVGQARMMMPETMRTTWCRHIGTMT
jgi:hypothetical protein